MRRELFLVPSALGALLAVHCVALREEPLSISDTGVDSGTVDSSIDSESVDTGAPDTNETSVADADAGNCFTAASPTPGVPCAVEAKSCDGLTTKCAGESCCTTLFVPAGVFQRGYDKSGSEFQGTDTTKIAGWQAEDNAAKVAMYKFWLDRYEVSVGRFRKFLDAYDSWHTSNPIPGGAQNKYVANSGWDATWNSKKPTSAALFKQRIGLKSSNCGNPTWTDDPGANEDKPINCVNWYDASLFCAWDLARLPTEAEWNYAAAGGAQQRAFPWSMPANDTTLPSGAANVATGKQSVVGSILDHDGYWGHRDLAGGVFEWVFDGNGTSDFGCSFPTLKGIDAYTSMGSHPAEVNGVCRLLRGGSYKLQARFARTAARMALTPGSGMTPDGGVTSDSFEDVGFRCARDVME